MKDTNAMFYCTKSKVINEHHSNSRYIVEGQFYECHIRDNYKYVAVHADCEEDCWRRWTEMTKFQFYRHFISEQEVRKEKLLKINLVE